MGNKTVKDEDEGVWPKMKLCQDNSPHVSVCIYISKETTK